MINSKKQNTKRRGKIPRNKKAIGFYFFAKLVLGVITLVLLGILLVKLFSIALESNDRKRAQETINQLKLAMENARSEDYVRQAILSPKGWYLLSYDSQEMRDLCKEGRCLCMCEREKFEKFGRQIRACLGKAEGVCDTLVLPVKTNENADYTGIINSVPYPITIKYSLQDQVFRFYNFDIFNFRKDVFFEDWEGISAHTYSQEGVPSERYKTAFSIITVINANEDADTLLLWSALEYTDFAEILRKESNEKNIHPFLILAILKTKYHLFEIFEKEGNDESARPLAAQKVRESVFERAKQILTEEDFKRECLPPIVYSKSPNKEKFNKEVTALIKCLAGTIKTAEDEGEEYNIYKKTKSVWTGVQTEILPVKISGEEIKVRNIETAVVYWYSGDLGEVKTIWENFNLYTK